MTLCTILLRFRLHSDFRKSLTSPGENRKVGTLAKVEITNKIRTELEVRDNKNENSKIELSFYALI